METSFEFFFVRSHLHRQHTFKTFVTVLAHLLSAEAKASQDAKESPPSKMAREQV